jgi:hypothetical protein
MKVQLLLSKRAAMHKSHISKTLKTAMDIISPETCKELKKKSNSILDFISKEQTREDYMQVPALD